MPKWGPVIKDAELDDLTTYLFSLKPKGEKLDF
jgi:mono/diheme cytochrome c family protein